MKETWRLIRCGKRPGAVNMAIDQALARSVAEGGEPALRLYGWSPPAVSLGYFQTAERELDLAACRALGIDVIRRPTGGRAVLHDREVTYALAVPQSRLGGGVLASYKAISEGLMRGLRELGIDVRMGAERTRPAEKGLAAACFAAPSRFELMVGERKLVGSAQVRRHGVVLQHGSIPMEWDAEKLFAVLRFPDESARRRAMEAFRLRATSVAEAAGRTLSSEAVADAVARGLSWAFGVRFREEGLTDRERREVREYMEYTEKEHSGPGLSAPPLPTAHSPA